MKALVSSKTLALALWDCKTKKPDTIDFDEVVGMPMLYFMRDHKYIGECEVNSTCNGSIKINPELLIRLFEVLTQIPDQPIKVQFSEDVIDFKATYVIR